MKELIKYLHLYNELTGNLEKQEKARHSLWNALLICNSLFISSFTIVITVNTDKIHISNYIWPFYGCVFIPIMLIMINYTLSPFYARRKTTQTVVKIEKKMQEKSEHKCNDADHSQFLRRCNTFFAISEMISLYSTMFAIVYLFCIIADLTK